MEYFFKMAVLFVWVLLGASSAAFAFIPADACQNPDYICTGDEKYYSPGDFDTPLESCKLAAEKQYSKEARKFMNWYVRGPISYKFPSSPIDDRVSCLGNRYYVYNDALIEYGGFTEVYQRSRCALGAAGRFTSTESLNVICVFYRKFKAVQFEENKGFNQCSTEQPTTGNPIKITTGEKFQNEKFYYGGDPVSFIYSSFSKFNSQNWRYPQDKLLIESNTTKRDESTFYNSRKEACVQGFLELKKRRSALGVSTLSWTGLTPEYSYDQCLLKKDGKVVSVLGITGEQPGDAQADKVVQFSSRTGELVNFYFDSVSGKYLSYGSGSNQQNLSKDVSGQWHLKTNDKYLIFDSMGRVMYEYGAANRLKKSYTYVDQENFSVKDEFGRQLDYSFEAKKLKSISFGNNEPLSFLYQGSLLQRVQRGDDTLRIYHYEDPRHPTALTGITDEKSVRYATWRYDEQGRAISSEHAGGTEKVSLTFNPDGSTRVVNALGKATTYFFEDFLGSKRVTKVTGEPTANCVGANQLYTYTAAGQVDTQTDWNGNVTKFTYDNQNREISRTEAFGTPQATTTQTCWHASLNKPARVIEPKQVVQYQYDATGKLTQEIRKPRPVGAVDCATTL